MALAFQTAAVVFHTLIALYRGEGQMPGDFVRGKPNRGSNDNAFDERLMNYRSMVLNITPEEAAEIIRSTDIEVRSRTRGNEIEFTTPGGYHVASLSPISLPDGSRGARLKYRTALVAPFAAHARRSARTIKATMTDYRAG